MNVTLVIDAENAAEIERSIDVLKILLSTLPSVAPVAVVSHCVTTKPAPVFFEPSQLERLFSRNVPALVEKMVRTQLDSAYRDMRTIEDMFDLVASAYDDNGSEPPEPRCRWAMLSEDLKQVVTDQFVTNLQHRTPDVWTLRVEDYADEDETVPMYASVKQR